MKNLQSIYTCFEYGEPILIPLTLQERKEFQDYLDILWQNRYFAPDRQHSKSKSTPFFSWQDGALLPQNYVGFVKWKSHLIEIYPKIFAAKPLSKEIMWKHLHYYLTYAQPQRYAWDNVSHLDAQGSQPLENAWSFYQRMMLAKIQKYIDEGFFQSHEIQTSTLPYLRGKIAMNAYLKKALSNGNWQKITTHHPTINIDNSLNQLLKYTLKIWQESTEDTQVYQHLTVMTLALKEVSLKIFSLKEAQQITLPLEALKAREILDFCIYFLENHFPNPQKGRSANFVWLVNMDSVYEQFVFRFIQKHFPEAEAKSQYPAYLAKTKQDQKPAFRIQSDIYLPHKQRLIDAKYKLRKAQGSVKAEDMYQMLSYSIALQCLDIVLLYPAIEQDTTTEEGETFEISEGLLGSHTVQVTALGLPLINTAATQWRNNLEKQIKDALKNTVS